MKYLRSFISVIIAALALSACGTMSIALPPAESLPDHEAAFFKLDSTVKNGTNTVLSGVIDWDIRKIILKSEGFKDYHLIKVAPGYYDVMLKVYSYGHIPAFPSVKVRATAGMTYLFSSNVIMNGKAIKAEYTEIPTASDNTPAK